MNIYIGEPVEVSDMQGPCPDGFHVPTYDEWYGLNNLMNNNIFTSNAVNYQTYLFIPIGGFLQGTSGSSMNRDSYGYYYTCTSYSSSDYRAYYLSIRSSNNTVTINYTPKNNSGQIRPFKDEYVEPDSTWTTLIQNSNGGIYWKATLGIISIKYNSTGYTIADKNLGATTVYRYGDTLSNSNCGNYYQRGNNYAFTYDVTPTTSSTQVNVSNYGPGNYYSSSTFITGSTGWDSSNNDNLRGGVSQGTSTKSVEVQNIFIGEKPYEGPLRFTAEESNSTIQLNKTGSPTSVTLETSTDGSTWSTYTFGTAITLSNIGDKVYFRNTSTTTTGFSTGISDYYQFAMTGSISCSGDVNYLLNKTGEASLSTSCYQYLFKNCSSLTTVPILPATTLANRCYLGMFQGCTNITTTPSLPATTAKERCYNQMFEGCTSLTTATSLPATTLGGICYASMFEGCTNLTTLPALPATTLTMMCYANMFANCSKIKISQTQTGEYQTEYRIPTTGTGTTATNALSQMFYQTGGTYTGGAINTTYYTSNTVV